MCWDQPEESKNMGGRFYTQVQSPSKGTWTPLWTANDQRTVMELPVAKQPLPLLHWRQDFAAKSASRPNIRLVHLGFSLLYWLRIVTLCKRVPILASRYVIWICLVTTAADSSYVTANNSYDMICVQWQPSQNPTLNYLLILSSSYPPIAPKWGGGRRIISQVQCSLFSRSKG